jgi:hypothetical protein
MVKIFAAKIFNKKTLKILFRACRLQSPEPGVGVPKLSDPLVLLSSGL